MDGDLEKIPTSLIGVAGVHFVAFKLSLRGLIVLPTIRNTAGIDLLVNDPRTGGHASLQVKTSMQWVKFWPASAHRAYASKSCCRIRGYDDDISKKWLADDVNPWGATTF